ncbi:MAG: DUF1778 domain-containing protein [Zoogloeaceae bacterium]|jgi:uncharacterized protein (DUF1778 family)|nr:DUF1778 domain-containing protein [Zoogloeaceae bacterium]
MTTARFDMVLEPSDKETFSRAAALLGLTMTAFVRMAAKEKADDLLDRESRIYMSQRDFQVFSEAINRPFEPNAALQRALRAASEIRRA